MTEPENNFEDDMFADLYDDNDAAPKPEPSEPVVDQFSAIQSAAAADNNSSNIKHEADNDKNQYQQYHNGDDSHMNNGDVDEDDDDDIDFNLGNGPTTKFETGYQDDSHSGYNAAPQPQAHVKGPNAKEDG
ncbi:hypothetical protein V8F06_001281 [Rhypophila decipiens]